MVELTFMVSTVPVSGLAGEDVQVVEVQLTGLRGQRGIEMVGHGRSFRRVHEGVFTKGHGLLSCPGGPTGRAGAPVK